MKKSANVMLTLITAAAVSSCTTEKPQVEDKEQIAVQDTSKTHSISSTPSHHTTVYPWYLFWRNWSNPKPTPMPTRGGFGKNGISHPATS